MGENLRTANGRSKCTGSYIKKLGCTTKYQQNWVYSLLLYKDLRPWKYKQKNSYKLLTFAVQVEKRYLAYFVPFLEDQHPRIFLGRSPPGSVVCHERPSRSTSMTQTTFTLSLQDPVHFDLRLAVLKPSQSDSCSYNKTVSGQHVHSFFIRIHSFFIYEPGNFDLRLAVLKPEYTFFIK